MYDTITESGRAVLLGASQKAFDLHHNFVRPEHLLLALLQEKNHGAYAVLLACDVKVEELVKRLEELTPPWIEEFIIIQERYPLTPQAQNVLLWAFEEARLLGQDFVCTQHILLGLLRETECVATRVLNEFAVTAHRAREEARSLTPTPIIVFDAV